MSHLQQCKENKQKKRKKRKEEYTPLGEMVIRDELRSRASKKQQVMMRTMSFW